ncbi:aquaporin-like protein [Hortaea werneckii]|nr:aquaporin-like protein [Hortaea werneckii]
MNVKQSDRFVTLPGQKTRETNPDRPRKSLRFPGLSFLPNKPRNHFIAFLGEFVGTFLFLFFAFAATQVANAAAAGADTGPQGGLTQAPNTSVLLYISLAFGFSLAVNAWVFFRITGGLFNPAVTLALALIGGIGWMRAIIVFIAQLCGAMAASGVVSALYPGRMAVSTTLGGGTSIAQGLFIEMFLTAMLIFTILMLAAEKHKGTFLAPIGIGLALFIAELAGVFFTGGSLNPARSFGPCVVLHSFPGYHWLYWVGPILGALLAVAFYRLVKILEYETANPRQDFNDKEAEAFNYDEENASTGADVARPNVAIGRVDYVADDLGVHPSNDAGQIPGTGARAVKAPPSTVAPSNAKQPATTAGVNGNGAGRTDMEKPSAAGPGVGIRATAPGAVNNPIFTTPDGEKVTAAPPTPAAGNDVAYRGGPTAETAVSQDKLGGSYR